MNILNAAESLLKFVGQVTSLGRELIVELRTKDTENFGNITETNNEGAEVAKAKKGTMTAESFADKVDYEGGVIEALRYGLTEDDLKDPDSPLAQKWHALRTQWISLEPLVNEVQNLLDDAWGTD